MLNEITKKLVLQYGELDLRSAGFVYFNIS
jgi:hypothetical protein